MPHALADIALNYQNPRGIRLGLVLVGLGALLLLSVLVVYATGGTGLAYAHLVYLPIILAGFLLGRWGGACVGLLAGAMLGPFMPLDVANGEEQAALSWLFRLVVFILAGALTGQMTLLLRERADRISDSYIRTLHSFASLIAARDEQVAGHCERVAYNAREVGSALGLPPEQLQALYWSGILHDLGKVAIPDRILLKAGSLDEEEYRTIRSHCELGADLVGHAGEEFALVAGGVRSHHERWDGTGYPRGLQGPAIPLFGRILGVVDVFEALTSDRPYRRPVGIAEASELLRREAGGHFDPAVVDRFLELLAEGKIRMANTLPAEGAQQPQEDQGSLAQPIGTSADAN